MEAKGFYITGQQKQQILDIQIQQNDESGAVQFIVEKIYSHSGLIFEKKYYKQAFLGRGGFANCYVTQQTGTNDRMATKIIKKQYLNSNRVRSMLIHEIKIHKAFSHPNIVQYLHHFEDSKNVYIMLELCQNKSLESLLKRRGIFTTPQIQSFLYGICNAIKYLHDKKYIHRDLKLGNIFLNTKFQVKIGDFGLTSQLQFLKENKRTVCGTPNYIAPQILQGTGYYFEVDIWAIGIIIYTLYFGSSPFNSQNISDIYRKIKIGEVYYPQSKYVPIQAIDLIKQILVPQPEKRLSIDEILHSPFMKLGDYIPLQLPQCSLTRAPSRFDLKYVPHIAIKDIPSIPILNHPSHRSMQLQNNFVIQKQNQLKNHKKVKSQINPTEQNKPFTNNELQQSLVFKNLKKYVNKGCIQTSNSIGYRKAMSSLQGISALNVNNQKRFINQDIVKDEPKQYLIDYQIIEEGKFYFCTNHYSLGIYEKDKQICFRSLLGWEKNNSKIYQINIIDNVYSSMNLIALSSLKDKIFLTLKAKQLQKIINLETMVQKMVKGESKGQIISSQKLVYIMKVSRYKDTITMFKLSNKCIQTIYHPQNNGFFYSSLPQKIFYFEQFHIKYIMKQLCIKNVAEKVKQCIINSAKANTNIESFIKIKTADSKEQVKLPISNLKHIYGIICELHNKSRSHYREKSIQ